MFEQLSPAVLRAFRDAGVVAREFRGLPIEVEHLLAAFGSRPETQAGHLLAAVRLTADDIRRELSGWAQSEDLPKTALFFGSSLRPLLELAKSEADANGHALICTGHLLLAMLANPTTTTGQLLCRAGLDLDAARAYVRETSD